MIPVLYPSTETSFTTNGLGGLPDAISCAVTEQRNTQGGYYLEMDYPIDGLHYADIAPERIIYAAPFMGATPQPFRISRINRPINGIVHIEAPHVSSELQKIVTYGRMRAYTVWGLWTDFKGVATNLGQTCDFTISTDINLTVAINFWFDEPISMMDLLMGVEGSMIDKIGGEIEFDKWNVNFVSQRGVDSGLEIRYGVNMSDIEAETDATELVTAVIPFWKGTVNDADTVVIGDMCSASNASAYSYVRCVPLDVTEQFDLEQDEQPTKADVTAKGTDFINSTSRKLLQTSIKVKYEPTTNGIGERLINLCDTVRVVYPDLGVSSISKVVETRFNVLTEQYDELTIGSIRNNIVDTIAGLISGGAITGGGGSSGGGGGSTAVTSVNGKTGAVVLNATDVGAMPNTYTAPVTSVNGMTGDVVVSGGSGGAVDSVNGQTGVVVLDAEDVGALPDDTAIPTKTSDLTNDSGFITSADIPAQSVTSVNGQTGAVVLNAADVGALASTVGVVRYDQAQTLTEGQKTQARANIGVSNASDKFNVFFGTNPNSTTVRIVKGNSVQVTGQEIKDQITVSQGGCILVVTDYDVSGRFIVYDLDDYTTSGAVAFYRVADGYRYTITVPLDSNVGTKAKVSLASGGGSVAYDTTQSLTAAQMRTARRNIGMPGYAVPLYYSLYSGQVSAGALYKINVDGTHESSPMTFSELYKLYSDDKCFIFAYEDGGNVYKLKTISTSGLTLNMIDGSTETILSINVGSEGSQSQQSGVNKTTVTIGGGGSAENAVLYTTQSLTSAQKSQARSNIAAQEERFVVGVEQSGNTFVLGGGKTATDVISHPSNIVLTYNGAYYSLADYEASPPVGTFRFFGFEIGSSGEYNAVSWIVDITNAAQNQYTITRRVGSMSGSAGSYNAMYYLDGTTVKNSETNVATTGQQLLNETLSVGIYPVIISDESIYEIEPAFRYDYRNSGGMIFSRFDGKYRIYLPYSSSTITTINGGYNTPYIINLSWNSSTSQYSVKGRDSFGNYITFGYGELDYYAEGLILNGNIPVGKIVRSYNWIGLDFNDIQTSSNSVMITNWHIEASSSNGVTVTRTIKKFQLAEYYTVTLNADGTVSTKDSNLNWSDVSARMSYPNCADYLLVTWGNSLFTAKAVEKLTSGDIKFICDVEHDGIQRHMIFTLTSANALQTTLIETYSRVPVTVWEVQDVTQGLIALNTNISSSLAWQLTNLNLSPFKRIKVYVKAGRKTGALSADSSITPASIIEMSMDDRAKENASQNVFIGSSVVQNPNDPNRLGVITCAVSGDKTKFAVVRSTTLYGTAATSNTDAYPYVFKIEGYYD